MNFRFIIYACMKVYERLVMEKILLHFILMHFWPLRILNAWWFKNDVTIPFKVTKQMWFLLPLFYHRYYFFYPNILMLLMWIAPYIENTTTLNTTKNLKMTTKPDLRKQKNVNILSNSLFVINFTFLFYCFSPWFYIL